MNKSGLFVLFTLFVAASAKWPHLRRTFGIPGAGGFYPEPRTTAELEEAGWVKVSSCEDGDPT